MKPLHITRVVGQLATAEWADEDSIVVYDDTSGETLLLNLVERTALACLSRGEGEVSFETWVERIAQALDAPADPQLRLYLEYLVKQFEEIGFVHCKTA